MSLFSRLFGKGSQPPNPDALRQGLFAVSGDARQLEALCRGNHDLIRQHFDTWRKMPPELQNRPDEMQKYAHGLIAVALRHYRNVGHLPG